ncbi:RNA-binding protein [Schizosaccharomyces octosporus yFS286]|uniref:RNA-binding protein n=1 Tax=Schizosaccharomyces octosporus (strain yFS286) TaxID=483514 RepID=S9Q2X0_SCHOY|nr:RNA-binding protein [Schizosaccharomyces octosporus yFS286]EPX74033.1 RNA-binding protein [Schizosaccharomyces octosporus yFS286]
MDSYVLSFSVPDPSPPPSEETALYASKCDFYGESPYECIRRTAELRCTEAQSMYPVTINLHAKHKTPDINISRNEIVIVIAGAYECVYSAKIYILQALPKLITSRILLDEPLENLLFDDEGFMYEDTIKHFNTISELTGAKLYLIHRSLSSGIEAEVSTGRGFSYRLNEKESFRQKHLEFTRLEFGKEEEADSSYFVVFYGDYCSVEHARIRFLTLLDELRGLSILTIPISASFQPILMGKAYSSSAGLKATETMNIYTLPFFSDMLPRLPNMPELNSSKLVIAGESESLKRLEEAFYYAEEHLKVFTHIMELSFTKLIEFLTNEIDELRLIMEENSSFLRFPDYFKEGKGSCTENSQIKIYSSTLVNAEKTALRLAKLSSKYVEGRTKFDVHDNEEFLRKKGSWKDLPFLERNAFSSKSSSATSLVSSSTEGNNSAKSPNKLVVPPTEYMLQLAIISMASGVEMLLKSNEITFSGQENTTPVAMEKASKVFHKLGSSQWHQILLDAPTKDLDFISGKKNGKLDKVKQQCKFNYQNGDIIFCPMSSTIFTVDIYGDDLERVIKGMNTMLLEFPAEMHFFIPEEIHKKLIGFRGEQIQRVTKLYNSYIEFSTTPFDCYGHNVLIRTPSKFSENLWAVRSLFVKTAEGLGYGVPKYLYAIQV